MKMSLNRKIAMIMTFVLIVPLFWNLNIAVAKAATPSFAKSNIEIVGTGETYQIEINDKVNKSTYSWSSSNEKIATVTSKGLVTSVDKGTATIKCKITYPSKKTKTISCKVTVTIPADDISISNASLVNGAYVMSLGSTMDFDTQIVPANSSDKVYWSIGGGDASCIRIDDASAGRITATRAGKVILKATAAAASTQQAADLSIVNDAVIIEVVGPTATVKSVDITSTNEIKVVFDSAVNASTVIGASNTLSGNIELTMSKDTKGVLADDPGALTASLSTDMKTLTITSKNALSGYYGINFSSAILTTDGVALESYYKKIFYVDVTPPSYAGTTTDDSGYIATIAFTEALDFTNLKISGAALVSTTGETASATTISTLNNVLNYTISDDKKSISINMSKIAVTDYGKLFSVVISGVTDKAGNIPANAYILAYLRTDTSAKPQARVLTVSRTSYNNITVTFDRAIQTQFQFGGILQIDGGVTISGVVDMTNNKKVTYTMTDAQAASYTGLKKVSVGYWNSYNVISTDTSANKMTDFYIDFSVDKTSPYLTASSYDADKGILTLTYNKDVNLTSSTGIFSSTFTSVTDDIKPNTNISYTKISHTDGNNIIKLQLTGATLLGTYTFTLDQYFVTDNFKNPSLSRAMVITNTGGTLSELPGPYSITQSSTNLSEISLKFLYKLDKVSAETISNYKITGLTIIKASLTENTSTGATVVLTVADGSIEVEVARPVTITGVKGYNNSYSAITSYSTTVTLKDNKKPTFIDPAVFDSTTKSVIRLNFSEAIQGTMTVKVYYASTTIEIPCTVSVNGNAVYINLSSIPSVNSWLRIDILSNNIKDLSGNTVSAMPSSLMALATY
ncbi:MAG TPA: Ig-like domain-containing protein [Mobilitalea sp.]|nr:Ig-like domain-containing protein [Mobilitalea sp.]